MRIDRFYLPQSIHGDSVTVTDERLLHQWKSVLRAKPGFELVLFDGSGAEYGAVIQEMRSGEAVLSITDKHHEDDTAPAVWLYAALIKRDKFEWIIEKATELGVAGIVPLAADRSDKKNIVYERAQKIIVEAAEQSGRVRLPEIAPIQTVDEALDHLSTLDGVADSYMFDKDAGVSTLGADTPDLCAQLRQPGRAGEYVRLFVGPEGGWSDREKGVFQEKGVRQYSLGKQNLKTETAAICVAGLALVG
ncbi:MAG: RsmE family RNA methyltransferase [Candidatus Paceibacterota bacterium]